jgi:hypothetical protein
MSLLNEFVKELDIIRRNSLDIIYQDFFRDFIKAHQELFASLSPEPRLADESAPSRYRILTAMASVYYHKTLFDALMAYLPGPVRQVYMAVVWEGKQQVQALEKRLGVTILSGVKLIHEPQPAVLAEYFMIILYFSTVYNPRESKYEFSNFELGFPRKIRAHLKKMSDPPAEALIRPLPQLPATRFVYENEDAVLNEFAGTYLYLQQYPGERITAATVAKVRKYFNLREFYPEQDKALASLRTRLLLQFADNLRPDKVTVTQPHQQIKALFEQYSTGLYENLPALLFHLKGSKSYIDEDTSVNGILAEVLASLPVRQWVSLENLIHHIRIVQPELLPVRQYMAKDLLYIDTQVKSGKMQQKIGEHLYFPVIAEPLIKGSFFLFAALGLADIAYTEPRNDQATAYGIPYFSVFDGLQYVRLTPLGAYVCGIYSSYEPPATVVNQSELILDEDRLMITLTQDDKVKALLLDKYAQRVGGNRFRVDFDPFLQDCENKKQVVKKIESFRKEIMAKPPAVWEEFFKTILARYGTVEEKKNFKIFKLPSSDKQLHSLIAKDEVLRVLVYKAESYHVLVNENDVPQFRQRLKQFGYLW